MQGNTVGPVACDALKTAFGSNNVACQGVGGAYTAGFLDNLQPKGTTDGAIAEATRLFTLAKTKCPSTKVIGGGYRLVNPQHFASNRGLL